MNGAVSKTVVGRLVHRGFESHPLRCIWLLSSLAAGVAAIPWQVCHVAVDSGWRG